MVNKNNSLELKHYILTLGWKLSYDTATSSSMTVITNLLSQIIVQINDLAHLFYMANNKKIYLAEYYKSMYLLEK